MHLIGRRNFLRGMGLGAGAGLLTPLVSGLLSEASGAAVNRKKLVVLTSGNGWGHQGQPRNPMSENGNLFTKVRSETDWDLPTALAPLAALKSKLTIAGVFYNPHGGNQHGCGQATLSVVPTGDKDAPGGISFDRYIGKELYPNDQFRSTVFAPAHFGKLENPAEHTSADGPGQQVLVPNNPVAAYDKYLAGVGGTMVPGLDPKLGIAQDKGLVDAMLKDIERVRKQLVGREKAKFDQIIESTNSLSKQIAGREGTAGNAGKVTRPMLQATGLSNEVIRSFNDLGFNTLALGLTHVVHLSILGHDAFNDGWNGLNLPYDAHEALAHGQVKDMPNFDYTAAQQKIIAFHAAEIAHLFEQLKAVPEENGTMADNTILMWVNSGGGKHHDGGATIPFVTVGDLGGAWPAAGKYTFVQGTRCISDAFVSVANALGLATNTFGDPMVCKGPAF